MKTQVTTFFYAFIATLCLITSCKKLQEDLVFTKKLVKTNYNGKDATAFSYDAQGRMSVIKSIGAGSVFEATLDYQQGKVMETVKSPLDTVNVLNELNNVGLAQKTFSKRSKNLRYDTTDYHQMTYDNDRRVTQKLTFIKNKLFDKRDYVYQNGKLINDSYQGNYQITANTFTEITENTYEYQTNIVDSKGSLGMDFRGKLSTYLPSKHFETNKSILNNIVTFHTLVYDHSYEVDTEGYVLKEVQKVSLFAKSDNFNNFSIRDSVRTFIYTYQ